MYRHSNAVSITPVLGNFRSPQGAECPPPLLRTLYAGDRAVSDLKNSDVNNTFNIERMS